MPLGRHRRAVEHRLHRRTGASPVATQAMAHAVAGWNDWRGECIGCGLTRRGSIHELTKPCPECGFIRPATL